MKRQSPFAPRQRARRRAVQALYQWQMAGGDINAILRQFVETQDMSQVDVDFFRTLCEQVVKKIDILDAHLETVLDRPMDQLEQLELAVLRLGVAELKYHPETPYKVAISEAVDLAHRFGSESGDSYVNAVLDKSAGKLRDAENP